ncbi:MAG: hypothetical protein ACOYYS_19090 [Chloroflexota bacterium]
MSPTYQNFRAAIYTTVYQVLKMNDLDWLEERFELLNRCIKVGKVYLETHRDLVVAEEATLLGAKKFFESRGVQVSGGITITVNERMRFKTYCYTNPEHRERLKSVVALTARLFDEVILDDFFFTNCKCPLCVEAKGEQSWTDFRLRQMTEAARDLILAPARAANPKVEVVIKYPNWYEHFQGLGFNLETQPPIFDGIYTGTETRDPYNHQHLQQYESYAIVRYFENIKPGGNRGGWVDPFASFYLDRYAEQLWLTAFAKAPEITLFDFGSIQRPLHDGLRAAWQDEATSFDFDALTAPLRQADGTLSGDAIFALAAGAAFEQVDRFLGQLGNPLGVKSYKPYHSTGEDFLHNYLGMIGIPIDIVPEFPQEEQTILLTEAAKFDPDIVGKIKGQLAGGKTVVVTSGLFRALEDRGIRDIVEMHVTGRKLRCQNYLIGWDRVIPGAEEIVVPQIEYLTNDSWEEVSCQAGVFGGPLFHSADYSRSKLYILTIPDNFGDLYRLPVEVLNRIRFTVVQDLFVRLEAPAQVALFVYENHTLIVESFLPEATNVRLVVDDSFGKMEDLLTGETLLVEDVLDWRGEKTGKQAFSADVKPHSFRVFRLSQGTGIK